MQTLQEILQQPELENKLLNQAKTVGFVTAMACCPNVLSPEEWLPFLWGGEEIAPFSDPIQLENYFEHIIALWNETRSQLLEGNWQWPTGYLLDEAEIVNQEVRDFCEGMLQGWQSARDDWEVLMPENSADNTLLGGVLLSLSMLYDPETSIATLYEQGFTGLEQFAEIYHAIPVMLCGITQRGVTLAEAQ
ncbi:YecA family protein [Vibrio cholerae]